MSKKILIVDDSSTSRVMHRYLITKNTNYDVLCAQDGLQALDLAWSERPDIILMDVQMPELDGIEACRRLRKDTRTQSVRVTFKTDQESVALGRESGANEYLSKPVEEALLIRTVRRYLD